MYRIRLHRLLLTPVVFLYTHILMEHMAGGKGGRERERETVCILLSLPYICLKSNFMRQIFLENFSTAVRYLKLPEEELEKIWSQRELLCCEKREFLTKCSPSAYRVFQQVADLGFSQQCYDGNQSNFLAFTPGGAK